MLAPVQEKPQDKIKWQGFRLSGQDALAVRASKKLINEEQLITKLACTRLRMEVDRIPLWRGNHVEIKQIVEDFARYLYLPRLKHSGVLLDALRDGLDILTWEQDSFAYAESFDEATERYRGLRVCENVTLDKSFTGLLVRPEVALNQLNKETQQDTPTPTDTTEATTTDSTNKPFDSGKPTPSEPAKPKRYHGTVTLDPERVGRDAGKIAEEVMTHLVGLVGSSVNVTLEIKADIPNGAPENIVRIVTENGRTLKFTNQGFEME